MRGFGSDKSKRWNDEGRWKCVLVEGQLWWLRRWVSKIKGQRPFTRPLFLSRTYLADKAVILRRVGNNYTPARNNKITTHSPPFNIPIFYNTSIFSGHLKNSLEKKDSLHLSPWFDREQDAVAGDGGGRRCIPVHRSLFLPPSDRPLRQISSTTTSNSTATTYIIITRPFAFAFGGQT